MKKHAPLVVWARFLHISAGVFNVAFVYTPLHQMRFALPMVQYATMPLLLMTGLFLTLCRRRVFQRSRL